MIESPTPPGIGSCCGFEVRSELEFQTLRAGGGVPLHVREEAGLAPAGETIISWPIRPEHPFHGRLLRDGDRYAFWASDAGWFIIDPTSPTIVVEAGRAGFQRELRLFGVPTSLCVLERGDVSIHAAAAEVDGRGVLLAGPSRYGKTTLAAALASAGHRLLAEDTTSCTTRLGRPAVFPGPAAVRLRSDVAAHIRLSGVGVPDGDPDRVRTVLDVGTRGNGDPVPLGAIVFLRTGAGKPSVAPVPAPTAIRDLLALTFRLPSTPSQAATFERVTDLVRDVVILDLHRPATIEHLPDVIELLRRSLAAG